MPKASTPSFIVELPLRTTAEDERLLTDRLECGKRLYNTLLQSGFAIITAMRNGVEWERACALPHQNQEQRQVRAAAFQQLRQQFGFNVHAFEALATELASQAGFNRTGQKRIGSHEIQAIAKRVFNALNEWVLGKRGKPRFKGHRRPLHSLEGKNNSGMLQWKAEQQVLQIERNWTIPVILPDLKKDEWLASALQSPTKYCRILWRWVKGQKRWYVQLIQSGQTPVKARHLAQWAAPDSQGGIDIGPSEIAWVTTTGADKQRFCECVERQHRAIKSLQQHIDRQRRANNPQNYQANGTIKPGRKIWKRSQRQQRSEQHLKEMFRCETATRKREHGELINFLLKHARHWRDDGVSAKALQRRFGRSISIRAPGLFMTTLQRKAERAGGSREIINVRVLKTSQYDHTAHDFVKKPLSQRWHVFRDGRGRVQRDIYSAFLALHSSGDTYQPERLEQAWKASETMLTRMGWYQPDVPASRSNDKQQHDSVGRSHLFSAIAVAHGVVTSIPSESSSVKAFL